MDPSAESAESMTGYQYAMNSPLMMNDPLENAARLPVEIPAPGSPGFSSNGTSPDITAGDMANEFGTGFGGIPMGFGGSGGGGSGGGYSGILAGTFESRLGAWEQSSTAAGLAVSQITYENPNARISYHQVLNSFENGPNPVTGGYSFNYDTPAPGGWGVVGHTVNASFNYGDANQGGWPWSSKSDPASWVFTTASSNRNVQTAGVTGIDFSRHDIRYSLRNDELTVIAVHVRLPTLYFEYPKITNMFFKNNEVLTSGFAALIMARATDRAVDQLRGWFDEQENPTEWSTQIQFMKFLTGQVLRDGGRVTPAPNYAPVIVTPYRRL
ncbi:hypothetical protein [Mucilaginibacter sp. NFX135]|uniref:hypothetical protein n=1 Tax=Mucilaginibacter sp. NFX135 TaxID=3402687 RepID=UPI003AFB7CA6